MTSEESFRQIASVIRREDLAHEARLIFVGLMCDVAFREGWRVSIPPSQAEESLPHLKALQSAGAIDCHEQADGTVMVGLAAELMQ